MSQVSLKIERGELIKPTKIGCRVDVVDQINKSCLRQHGVYSLVRFVQPGAGSSFGMMGVPWGVDKIDFLPSWHGTSG
tara:strand:- start:1203 stop:1436 length:234 start_codon:yes stop_codon:yes gene_type:complete